MPPNQRVKIQCDNCRNWIDYLEFIEPIIGTDSGSISLPMNENRRNYEDTNTDRNGPIRYFCPNCDNEINIETIQAKTEEYIRSHQNTQTQTPKPKKKILTFDNDLRFSGILRTPSPDNIAEENPGTRQYIPHQRFNINMPIDKNIESIIIKCPKCKYEFKTETYPDGYCLHCHSTWIIQEDEIIIKT